MHGLKNFCCLFTAKSSHSFSSCAKNLLFPGLQVHRSRVTGHRSHVQVNALQM